MEALEFEVDDNERRHLQEMTKHPGYRVFLKIQQAYIEQSMAGAILTSKDDPLADPAKIARAWAYVRIAEEILQRMEAGVQFELRMLKSHEPAKLDPVAMAARRRHILLGELDPAPER